MVWLGMIYAVCGMLVLLGGLTTGRSVVVYRIQGRQRARALRGAATMLALAAIWSAATLSLWVARGADPLQTGPTADLLLWALPLLVGWGPGALFLVLALGETPGRGGPLPNWVRWMDLLWMG